MPTFRLDLAYDGSGFHGFARQPGVRTVQGELEEALGRISGETVTTTCAGRTDAGVHARGQVVSFATQTDLDAERLVRSLNRMLGPELAVWACRPAAPDFDARFSARWRAYRYRVSTAPVLDPLLRHFVWHVPESLDQGAMGRAVAHVVGEHDFASFCRAAEGKSTVRRVLQADWSVEAPLLVFRVRATSFCHQMVRSLTGFCVEVGRGRRHPDSVPEVLAARDRAAAGPVAPPHGLVLWEVGYDGAPTSGV